MPKSAQDKEVEEGKFFAVTSYIAFLCILGLVLKRDNKFVLYHAKQGLVLFVLETVAFILSIIPFLGAIIKILGLIIFILLSLWGILQALNGKTIAIPLVSKIAEKIII